MTRSNVTSRLEQLQRVPGFSWPDRGAHTGCGGIPNLEKQYASTMEKGVAESS